MKSELRITPNEKHLLAVVTGPYSLPEAKDDFTRILAACATHKLSSVIVDVREVTIALPMTTMKRFEFAEFLARKSHESFGLGVQNLRLALVGSKLHVDPNGFGETVGRNRGLNLKITTDMAEALAWIES